MNESYIGFFRDIDQTITENFGKIAPLKLKIIGFVALSLAGLPDRGTKDVDMMEIEAVAGSVEAKVLALLAKEFGNKSPGLYRHGMFLDMVPACIPWLPPQTGFQHYLNLQNIEIFLSDPTDVCVSKVFSLLKSRIMRARDRQDILDSLNKKLIACKRFVQRVDDALSAHEMQADAPEIYPKAIRFMNDEIIANYGNATISLNYEIPNWMKNMQG